ncbi:Gfa-like protein [hydrothermal vent metagenome]|uniref:Gfa-like protein n=1 Tax=hydrothermal vent metagenome TaxID=652676 RepID=A0A3B0VMD1_9ZZZZ
MNKGSCLCKSVQVEAEVISHNVGVCHCRMCRKWAGGSLLAVETSGVVNFKGEDNITSYKSSDWAQRGFCKNCGTHLFYHLLSNNQYIIPAGLFDSDAGFVLGHQIFIEEKPGYYNFAEKTKKMTGAEAFKAFSHDGD